MKTNHTGLGLIKQTIERVQNEKSLFESALKKLVNSSEEELKKFLTVTGKLIGEFFTIYNESIKIDYFKSGFHPQEFFSSRINGAGLSLGLGFKESIIDLAHIVDDQRPVVFSAYDLNNNVSNRQILVDLSIRPIKVDDALWVIASLIKKQYEGGPGVLQTNGSANLFFLTDKVFVFVVNIFWRNDVEKWHLDFYRTTTVVDWKPGCRVFDRNWNYIS